MPIARNIRYLRKKHGWGQDVLAEKLGYKSYTTIQKWESGVSEPPLKVVHALANIFHVDINDLATVDLEFSDEIKQPTVSDGLTDEQRYIIDLAKSASPEQATKILQVLKVFLGNGQ